MKALLPILLLATAPAFATTIEIGNDGEHCDLNLNTGIKLLDNQVVVYERHGAKWQMHDGKLWRDGKMIALSSSESESLRRYEQGLRELVPQIAGVAREGLQIGAEATRTAFSTMLGSEHHSIKNIDRRFKDLAKTISENISNSEIRSEAFDDESGELRVVGDAMALTGTVVGASMDLLGQAVHAIFDDEFAKDLEKRADKVDKVDKVVEERIKTRADALEIKAEAMCKTMQDLNDLEDDFVDARPDLRRLDVIKH